MNLLFVIAPYKYEGMWVFDDPAVGLSKEPFIAGIDMMIDKVVADIPNAEFFTIVIPAAFGSARFSNLPLLTSTRADNINARRKSWSMNSPSPMIAERSSSGHNCNPRSHSLFDGGG